jgi:predicted kinase
MFAASSLPTAIRNRKWFNIDGVACMTAAAVPAEPMNLSRRSLIVLCGPAGAGKSSVAGDVLQRNRLASTAVVSSDACRLMLCDETGTLTAAEWTELQPMTFRLFLTMIEMRMRTGRPVLGDGVNLHPELRTELLGFARAYRYRSVLVVFDVSVETCLARNAQREESRRIPDWQIRAQRQALDELLPRLTEEDWDDVVVLDEQRRTVMIDLDR